MGVVIDPTSWTIEAYVLIWRGTPHLIVSGDQDLLVLQAFEGIPIVTAAQALERLKT
jgi:predicted nucleic acid-binding protein